MNPEIRRIKKPLSEVPAEDGTVVIYPLEATHYELDVLCQKWNLDGIKADSLIFFETDD